MKQKNKFIMIISVFLVSVCFFCAMFIFLYNHDNKYTHNGTQPIAGTLILSQENLDEEKIFYLSRGWQFYPNQLLTPNDLKKDNAFMQEITIGKYNTFSNFSGGSYGSGTYCLSLQLPNKEKIYSLILPEIYSSYTFYLNGQRIINMGDPNPESLNEQVGEQTLTFVAQGSVELVIIVSNQSHFYSGLTFPPLFGLNNAVEQTSTMRLLIGSIALLLSMAVALFSLYLYFKLSGKKDKRILFFFGSSLCIFVSFLYPVLFRYSILSPKPWYAFELFSIYGVYLFAVLLQNKIFEFHYRINKISVGIIGSFCILSFLYGLLPSYSVNVIQGFGWMSTFIKIFTAIYLLCSTLIAMFENQNGSKVLLFCTTGFGLSLLFDRILPAFEPIYCGWFPEYGGVIIIFGLGSILWKEIGEAYHLQIVFAEEKHQLTQQVAIQKAHYFELTNKIKETTRFRHDERHHLKMLYTFLENKDYEKLEQYLSEHIIVTMPNERTLLCENLIIDAVLQYYHAFCKEYQINFVCHTEVPPEIPFKDTELSVLLCNLMENAYEAVLIPGCINPFISINIKFENSKLILLLENSYLVSPIKKGDKFLSSKHEGYGIGTDSISSIVKQYRGQINYRYNNSVFCVSIILYLNEFE